MNQDPPLVPSKTSLAAVEAAINEGFIPLIRLGMADPVRVLVALDAKMRGLWGPACSQEQINWLMSAETAIRRSVGRKRQSEADLAILRAAYAQGALFLVVGAGVGQGAGLPGWKDLVVEMLDYVVTYGSDAHRQRVATATRTALGFAPVTAEERIAAELRTLVPLSEEKRAAAAKLRDDLRGRTDYTTEQLMQATQFASDAFKEGFADTIRERLYARPLGENRAFAAMASLVRPRGGPGESQPRLSSIITYNFDDFIELGMVRAGHGYTAHCSRAGEWVQDRGMSGARPSAIDIYHVHGFAPQYPLRIDRLDFVFSEAQYRKMYGDDAALVTATQRAFLQGSLGLLVGCSLTDEHALSELRAIPKARPGWFHYALMRGEPDTRSKEEYLKLGLRVLWFDEFGEIVDWLTRIGEVGGQREQGELSRPGVVD